MKKSTILILLIIFLGSVLIVGVFGMQAIPFEQIIYIKEITPTSVSSTNGESLEIKRDDKGHYYIITEYKDGLAILINTKVEPTDSTNKNLKTIIVNNKENNPLAEIGQRGEIKILRPGSVHLQYRTQDSATGPVMDFWIYTVK